MRKVMVLLAAVAAVSVAACNMMGMGDNSMGSGMNSAGNSSTH